MATQSAATPLTVVAEPPTGPTGLRAELLVEVARALGHRAEVLQVSSQDAVARLGALSRAGGLWPRLVLEGSCPRHGPRASTGWGWVEQPPLARGALGDGRTLVVSAGAQAPTSVLVRAEGEYVVYELAAGELVVVAKDALVPTLEQLAPAQVSQAEVRLAGRALSAARLAAPERVQGYLTGLDLQAFACHFGPNGPPVAVTAATGLDVGPTGALALRPEVASAATSCADCGAAVRLEPTRRWVLAQAGAASSSLLDDALPPSLGATLRASLASDTQWVVLRQATPQHHDGWACERCGHFSEVSVPGRRCECGGEAFPVEVEASFRRACERLPQPAEGAVVLLAGAETLAELFPPLSRLAALEAPACTMVPVLSQPVAGEVSPGAMGLRAWLALTSWAEPATVTAEARAAAAQTVRAAAACLPERSPDAEDDAGTESLEEALLRGDVPGLVRGALDAVERGSGPRVLSAVLAAVQS